jgi:hypothetical protein
MKWRHLPASTIRLSEAMTEREIETLARYNSEVGRGIMHRPDWVAKMAELQCRYDEAVRDP